jgi:hypothetical protein
VVIDEMQPQGVVVVARSIFLIVLCLETSRKREKGKSVKRKCKGKRGGVKRKM